MNAEGPNSSSMIIRSNLSCSERSIRFKSFGFGFGFKNVHRRVSSPEPSRVVKSGTVQYYLTDTIGQPYIQPVQQCTSSMRR